MREVIEKEHPISSVASSYGLVPQAVGNWVARYRKERATDWDRKKSSESAEISKLQAKMRTTVPAEDLCERPDLLGWDFTSGEPGRKWCGDIPQQEGGAPSYVRTWAGFIYLTVVLDCWSLEGRGLYDGRPHAHPPGVPGH